MQSLPSLRANCCTDMCTADVACTEEQVPDVSLSPRTAWVDFDDTQPPLLHLSPDCTDQHQHHKMRGACALNAEIGDHSQRSSIPETQEEGADKHKGEPLLAAPQDWAAAQKYDVAGDATLTDRLPQSHNHPPAAEIAPRRRRRMDSSQSSTQSNAGRSYDRYFRPVSLNNPSSTGTRPTHSAEPTKSSSPGHRPLGDEDAGTVQFDFSGVGGTNKTVSPCQDDSGFVDFGSLAHARHLAFEKPDQSPPHPSPETPVAPHNPFRHSRSQLLPASELFQGTQSSSPAKLASPTSSRPSPANFPSNSISPNPVISSPLKTRGLRSSPTAEPTSISDVLAGTTSSRLNGRASSPGNTVSTQNPVVPESSHNQPLRKRSVPEPMSTYEPMRKSQERRSMSEARSDPVSSGEDDDPYDSIARRRKARSKKEAALRQLTAISISRPLKSDVIEVPSTSQRRRTSQAEEHIARAHVRRPAEHNSERPRRDHRQAVPDDAGDEDSTQSDVDWKEAGSAQASTIPTIPELPRSSTKSTNQLARRFGIEGMSNGEAIPETSPTSRRPDLRPKGTPDVEPPASEAKSTPDFQSSPPAFSTRSKSSGIGRGRGRAPSSTSTLSNLTSTPELCSSNPGTVGTGITGSPTGSTIVASSSPAAARRKRREAHKQLPKPKTGSAESLRHSARLKRRGSNSTDELARSMSGTPTFEQSMRASRLSTSRSASRSGRAAGKLPQTQREQRLFEGMAFAVSFQSRKPGESNEQYNARMDLSAAIQRRIKQAGGRILENGFDELFEALPMVTPSGSPGPSTETEAEITLTREGYSTGFTALIADGHSRKVKYMQALALGLPCIATRWVTTCLDRNEVVDWMPYLLCAGQSAFLGDAIRSRNLTPYNASTAKLSEVVGQRQKLLEGGRILAVVKKSVEGRKMAYVFLARVLGASLTRVYSIEEARAELKAAQDSGRPFDWVYVDGKSDKEALFASGQPAGKKRKRASTTAAASFAGERPLKKIRTLSDELVIQSLILGRLIEEGELAE